MNWLSTMKTRSNLAASASRACSMYQLMLTLASPGISGSSQLVVLARAAGAVGTAPSLICRLLMGLLIGAVLP